MALTLKDLCELAEINTEDEESEHIAALLKEPIDRKTTGEAFAKLVGYDPTIMFDQIEMTKILDEFISDNNMSSIRREDIIVEAMDYINEHRFEYQITALSKAIEKVYNNSSEEAIVTVFDAWAADHYKGCKIVYDPDYDEDDDDEIDDEEEIVEELSVIGDDGYVSDSDYDADDDDDDDE